MARKKKIDETAPKVITTVLGYEIQNPYGKGMSFVEETVDFDYTLIDDIIKTFEEIRTKYGETYTNIKLDKDTVYGEYGYGDHDCEAWRFVGDRLETEKECADRNTKLDASKKAIEARERKEFDRLAAKFGSK